MIKTIALIISSSFILGLSAFGLYNAQQSPAKPAPKAIAVAHTPTPTNRVQSLRQSLLASLVREERLLKDNEQLRDQLSLLKDSIQRLNENIFELQLKIDQQAKYIQSLRDSIQELNTKYQQFKAQIATLSRKDQVEKDKIADLEQQKKRMRDQLTNLNQLLDTQEIAQAARFEIYTAQRNQEQRFVRLASIINDTQVNFQRVSLQKKRYGKNLPNLSKNDKHWKLTAIEFFLEHEDIKLLLDQQFLLKIVDSDNGELLSYIETNPSFPNSQNDSKGMLFTFDGNLVELLYRNSERKKGKNYELQIYFIDDNGREYLLVNGTHQMVENRKVTSLPTS